MDIRPVEMWDFSKHCVFVRRGVEDAVCIKHGGGGVMVWGCFAGDTFCDLFRIQGTFNQYGHHSILQRYAIQSGLGLVKLSFVFQQDNDATHLQAV
jgi:hypothetical protein